MSHQTQQPRQIGLSKPQTASPTVQLSVQVIDDSSYVIDPSLENYDAFMLRLRETNKVATRLYHDAGNRDPIAAGTMRAAANAIWNSNLTELQQHFLQRGVRWWT